MLIDILLLPLIDRDLQFDLFKAHILPFVHPQLKKVLKYNLESPYIALQNHGNYFVIPINDDILICTILAGHFCNLNTPLYPVDSITECAHHLLAYDKDKIRENCKISVHDYSHDTALNLDNNIWAPAVLELTELHITYLTYSYQIAVDTSFKLVELENSCQAYKPNFVLPSSHQMMEEKKFSLIMIMQRFFNYDVEYIWLFQSFLIKTFNISHLAQEELYSVANDQPSTNW